MQVQSFWEELQRRRVVRAVIGYGVAAFAVLQIIEPIMHGLHWPDDVLTWVVVALAAGFPVVIALAWIFDVNAGRVERTAPGPLRGLRVGVLLAGIGVGAAAPGLAWYLWLRKPAAPTDAPSIAVLPLLNLSSDREQEYFSDGLSEELLDLLAKVPGLRVAARTSAFAFKGQSADVREIGRKLGVGTVLEGSVRRAGDQIRITTQLINAADGYHLWSETYDRKLTGVFAVQDEIAQAVVGTLRIKLLPQTAAQAHRTQNTEAYNQYLLGKQFFSRSTHESYERAAQAFAKAVELDPQFAPAWAGESRALFWVADSAESAAAITEGQRKSLAAAEKAIAVAPDLPDGYVARGNIRSTVLWDWSGAVADFDRARALSPEDPEVLSNYAIGVLRTAGRTKEAIEVARKATLLDPLNPRVFSTLGSLLVMDGQYDAARAALDRSLEINPEQALAPTWLGVLLLLQKRPAEAIPAFRRSTFDVFRVEGEALAQHDLGHEKEAREALAWLLVHAAHDGAYQIAETYAWLGDADEAFRWLDRARAQRDTGLNMLLVDPLVRGLRADPRFAATARAVNLPSN